RWRVLHPCPGRWDLLLPNDQPKSRFCRSCQKPIRYCDSATDAWPLVLRGDAVVVSPAIARVPGDWGRFVPLPFTRTGVIQAGAALLERRRRPRAPVVPAPPPPVPDEVAAPLPRRRKGGRGRNRNIQRQNWEDAE